MHSMDGEDEEEHSGEDEEGRGRQAPQDYNHHYQHHRVVSASSTRFQITKILMLNYAEIMSVPIDLYAHIQTLLKPVEVVDEYTLYCIYLILLFMLYRLLYLIGCLEAV